MKKTITGFSKKSKEEKLAWLVDAFFDGSKDTASLVKKYWHTDAQLQELHDQFIENTISNYFMPMGVAPNFLINGKDFAIPMVIEESSVVAAASKAAKYWHNRGGFKTEVLSTLKNGQIHFFFKGNFQLLQSFFQDIKTKLIASLDQLQLQMKKRGGGLQELELLNKTHLKDHYFQLFANFKTADAMGANFINSCLEKIAETFKLEAEAWFGQQEESYILDVNMCILSNYVPNCLVKATINCPIEELKSPEIDDPQQFAEKLVQAVEIAQLDPYRAVTHNKGIMNGIDAVILATGNDFRAVEGGVHAFASQDGQYKSLSDAYLKNDQFFFTLTLPLSLGTVGGLTSLHPLVQFSLKLLGSPSATELMQIVAAAGLAQNFAALQSLTTTGIQQGHMKMHLNNLIQQLGANETESKTLKSFFKNKTISNAEVKKKLKTIRNKTNIPND